MKNIIFHILKNQYFSFKVPGKSMLPALSSRELVYFKKTNNLYLKVNDIVLIKKGKKYLAHRLIYMSKFLSHTSNDYIITKGDNNFKSDGKIYIKNIVGKVVKIKRNGLLLKPEHIYLIQSTLYFQEIVRVNKAFKKEKVDFVFLKGLPLHLYFEKSHPRRIYADCDVLIYKKDKDKTFRILRENGYKESDNALTSILGHLKNRVTEVSFIKRVENYWIVFDIHLDAITLINQFGKLDRVYSTENIEEINTIFLNEKRHVTIQNEKYPILSPVNLLIYLTYNYFHHNFRGIFRLEFIYQLLEKKYKKENVLSEILEKIKQYQLQNFVYPVFFLLEKYYDLKLPKKLFNSIRLTDDKLRYINENILNTNIFDSEPRIEAGINRFKNLFFLSPYPLFKRLLMIFNLQIIYSVFWVGFTKLHRRIIFFARSSFSRSR